MWYSQKQKAKESTEGVGLRAALTEPVYYLRDWEGAKSPGPQDGRGKISQRGLGQRQEATESGDLPSKAKAGTMGIRR